MVTELAHIVYMHLGWHLVFKFIEIASRKHLNRVSTPQVDMVRHRSLHVTNFVLLSSNPNNFRSTSNLNISKTNI